MTHLDYTALLDGARLCCETLTFGLGVFAALVIPPSDDADAIRAQLIGLLRISALLELALAPAVLTMRAATLADVPLGAAPQILPEVVAQTHAGRVWAGEVLAAAALAVTGFMPLRASTRIYAMSALAALLLLGRAVASHAIDKGDFAVAAYALHEAAASAWVGAIVGMLVTAPSGPHSKWTADVAQRVSRTAGWCILVLTVAGLYNAYLELGLDLDHLLYTSYGRVLIGKVATGGLAIGIGGYNRYWLIPRIDESPAYAALARNVATECVLLIAVLGWSMVLASTPPAH